MGWGGVGVGGGLSVAESRGTRGLSPLLVVFTGGRWRINRCGRRLPFICAY